MSRNSPSFTRPAVGLQALWSSLVLASAAAAQSPTILDSYPFVASRAVASEQPSSTLGTISDGSGGGVIRLTHTSSSLPGTLAPASSGSFDTRGMTMDIALSPTHEYVAANSAGLEIYPRTGTLPLVVSGTTGAWSVSQVALGATSQTIVAVGTQELDGTGNLVIVLHDRSAGTASVLATETLGAPVHAVAASTAIAASAPPGSHGFTVLVGLEDCASTTPSSLRRFDYVFTSGSLTPSTSNPIVWTQSATSARSLVRDIAIDGASKRAYVAAYCGGVLAFDVSPTAGLQVDTTPNCWPLPLPFVASHRGYATAIALDPLDSSVLVVGLGGPKSGEKQYLGDTDDSACNEGSCPALPLGFAGSTDGVFVYRLDSNGDPMLDLASQPVPESSFAGVSPIALSVRHRSATANHLYVDVAADTEGLLVLHASRASSSSPWVLDANIDSAWDKSPPGSLPLHAHDDVLVTGSSATGDKSVLVAAELSLTLFDVQASGSLSAATPRCEYKGGLSLAAFPDGNARIYASTSGGRPSNPGGIQAYKFATSSGAKVVTQAGEPVHKGGFGYRIAASTGLNGNRWLYSVSEDRDTAGPTLCACNGPTPYAVRIWDVGTSSAPRDCATALPASCPGGCCTGVVPDPETYYPPSTTRFCHRAVYRTSTPDPITNQPDIDRALEAIAVVDVPGSTPRQVIYALYFPSNVYDCMAPRPECGLLVLTVDAAGSGWVIQKQGTVPVFTSIDNSYHASSISIDGNRLFASWSIGGLAAFDISDPLAPVLIAKEPLAAGAYGITQGPMKIVPGPVAAQTSHARYVYVALLNDGIGLYKLKRLPITVPPPPLPYVFEAHASSPFRMRWQTTSLCVDPDDTSLKTLYVTQARGGVDHVDFSNVSFP